MDQVRYFGPSNPNLMGRYALALALATGKPYHFYMYGLFCTNFLKLAFKSFPKSAGGDRMFISQLALATPFRYVDKPLYIRRIHVNSIAQRYPDDQLGHAWEDPLLRTKRLVAIGPDMFKSQVIPWHRKILIPALIVKSAYWKRNGIINEIKVWVLGRFRRSPKLP